MLLLALVLAVSLPAAAAEKRAKPKAAASESTGGYSNYVEDHPVSYDKYLGDTSPLTEAQLMPALFSALDQLSKYPRTTQVPPIYRVSHERLEEMACTSKCGVLATYRPGEGIFLDESLKPETNLFDRSVLLHELVHYLQDINHEYADMKDCRRWYFREVEAYAIQKMFLTLLGSQIRVAYSAKESTCDGEYQAVKNVPPN